MNKKLQLITIHNYQLINYLKPFQKKLNIESTNIIPQCNQENGYFSFLGEHIQIYSHFDSSNLFYAQEDNDIVNILLNSDSNSNGCTQWFHFKIQAIHPTVTIKFKILNNRRSHQLFTVANLYTSKNNCFDIHYYKTNINHPYYASDEVTIAQYQKLITFYTLEFKYTFTDHELITFAYAEPYPLYRVLQLKDYKIIGYTKLNKPIIKIKKGISQTVVIILARQHPSETSGSFVAEELINLIDSKQYTYIIYPMVNPDGVFLGNSRCNTNGYDLNRKWLNPKIETEPEIYYIKQSLIKYQQNIKFVIDLHGHSRKQNYFIFGCSTLTNTNNRVQYFISQFQNYKHFSAKDCSVKIKPNRQSTARQMFWNEFNIQYSMTIEISMFGNSVGRFVKEDYHEIASQIYNSIEQFNENSFDLNIQQILETQNEECDSDDECDQDIIQDTISKRQENKNYFVKLKTHNQSNQEDVKIKQQILPKIRNPKPLNRSEHKSSDLIDIDHSFMYQLDQYKNEFSVRKCFPQRNIQPKRMSSIKRTSLNRDTTINIELLKKNFLIF